MAWREVGDHIFVRRHEHYDLNIGLVVGSDACLVIDTRETLAAGRELADAVRRITDTPWTVVNTHAHFDHFFGNGAFVPCDIWALDRCRDVVVERADDQLSRHGDGRTEIVAPTRTFPPPSTHLDVGGRAVELHHLGRGHTDNDIVVTIDDVLFAGDLVEEGGPPQFGDAYPAEWPATVAALQRLIRGPVVPGHGDVVDAQFVQAQQQMLSSVAHLDREAAARAAMTWSPLAR
jgi:glyoxylase-like metal-dependent hydrolase (beta-lactamase superfamily II)